MTIDLRAEMAKLPEPPDLPWPDWTHWRHILWDWAQHNDPAGFTECPTVYHNMLVRHRPMDWRIAQLPAEYRAICEQLPEPLRGNCYDQAYHVRHWERWTGRRIAELASIKEFGGGYGQMEWLCRKLGFEGAYYVLDLPEGRLLQKWWLGTQGIEARDGNLENPDLLIGCYSVSESPYWLRAREVPGAGAYLFTYSEKHGAYDNTRWFGNFLDANADKSWQHWQMEDRPTEWYAIC